MLRELHQSQWGSRSGFLPAFDRFTAGFAGGCRPMRWSFTNSGTITWWSRPWRRSRSQAGWPMRAPGSPIAAGGMRRPSCSPPSSTTHVLEVRQMDFLRGDEPYKGQLHQTVEMLRLVAGKGVVGRLEGVTQRRRSKPRRQRSGAFASGDPPSPGGRPNCLSPSHPVARSMSRAWLSPLLTSAARGGPRRVRWPRLPWRRSWLCQRRWNAPAPVAPRAAVEGAS